jgi:AcrR family transcriptional regulator
MAAGRSPDAGRRLTRKEQQAQTRSCLLRSAVRVFARRGLQHASIDEVAADAGYTKGAFYANFASKEDLFLAMLDERFEKRLAQIRRLMSSGEEIDQQAREAGEEFAAFLASDPDWQRLFFEFAAHATRNEAFRKELVQRYGTMRAGMADAFALRVGELDVASPVPPEQIALMTFAMANGFALERLLEPDAAPDELFSTMLVVFFAGLRALAAEAQPAAAGPAPGG